MTSRETAEATRMLDALDDDYGLLVDTLRKAEDFEPLAAEQAIADRIAAASDSNPYWTLRAAAEAALVAVDAFESRLHATWDAHDEQRRAHGSCAVRGCAHCNDYERRTVYRHVFLAFAEQRVIEIDWSRMGRP